MSEEQKMNKSRKKFKMDTPLINVVETKDTEKNAVNHDKPMQQPVQEEVKPEPIKKNPYFEPNKSAKLSEDVITKVKMLTPFIHKRHGYDLRATNSFIDIVLDFYAENALDENEKEDFKKVYEVMTAPKRDSK